MGTLVSFKAVNKMPGLRTVFLTHGGLPKLRKGAFPEKRGEKRGANYARQKRASKTSIRPGDDPVPATSKRGRLVHSLGEGGCDFTILKTRKKSQGNITGLSAIEDVVSETLRGRYFNDELKLNN